MTDDRVASSVEPPGANPGAPPRSARALAAVGRVLVTAGVVVLLFVAYELWGTNIQESRAQRSLRTELDDRLASAASVGDFDPVVIDAGTTNDRPGTLPTPSSTLPGGYDPTLLSLFFPPEGDAVARIELPTIGVDKVVVRGVSVADLRTGPGHYPTTALPGNPGNTSIAGHRTTYGAPFGRIDELVPGDEVVVTGVQGEFTYRVLDPDAAYDGRENDIISSDEGHIIVQPDATWVLDDFGDDRLTLTACHPKLSARQRIIVAAELVDEPVPLPEWAARAQEEILGGTAPGLGADEIVDDEVDDSDSGGVGTGATLETAGLSGERDAIPGAVLWMLAAIAFWAVGPVAGRRLVGDRWGGIAGRFAGLVPALICLWLSFEMIDRALPAA